MAIIARCGDEVKPPDREKQVRLALACQLSYNDVMEDRPSHLRLWLLLALIAVLLAAVGLWVRGMHWESLMSVSPFVQQVVIGVVIALAVMLDVLRRKEA